MLVLALEFSRLRTLIAIRWFRIDSASFSPSHECYPVAGFGGLGGMAANRCRFAQTWANSSFHG